MAGQGPQQIEDDSPEGAPAWMLTFSDCMTLLLTFFVMLLSFSSFDESAGKQLCGAMKFRSFSWLSDNDNIIDDAVAVEVQPVEDLTDKGAEKKPDSKSLDVVRNPKESARIFETDAYHDVRALNIPAGRLFVGDSSILTTEGQGLLETIASFMKLMPCHAIIGADDPHRSARPAAGGADGRLLRSWIVLQFFTQRQGLPGGRFRLSAGHPWPMRSSRNEPTVQIVLMAKNIAR